MQALLNYILNRNPQELGYRSNNSRPSNHPWLMLIDRQCLLTGKRSIGEQGIHEFNLVITVAALKSKRAIPGLTIRLNGEQKPVNTYIGWCETTITDEHHRPVNLHGQPYDHLNKYSINAGHGYDPKLPYGSHRKFWFGRLWFIEFPDYARPYHRSRFYD